MDFVDMYSLWKESQGQKRYEAASRDSYLSSFSQKLIVIFVKLTTTTTQTPDTSKGMCRTARLLFQIGRFQT